MKTVPVRENHRDAINATAVPQRWLWEVAHSQWMTRQVIGDRDRDGVAGEVGKGMMDQRQPFI